MRTHTALSVTLRSGWKRLRRGAGLLSRIRALALVPVLAAVLGVAPAAQAQTKLSGTTIEYGYDGADVHDPDWGWSARAYVPKAAEGSRPRPLVVFLHGVNRRFVPHLWMGAKDTPDLRKLFDKWRIEPAIVAAPSSTRACVVTQALWTGFDLDRFVAHTARAIRDTVPVDVDRVVLVGHSGAGCNRRGGLMTAMRTTLPLRAVLVVDVCMSAGDGRLLASVAHADTPLVVSWQPRWRRDVQLFTRELLEESQRRGARALRLVEHERLDTVQAHTTIVAEALGKWLPRWLGPEMPRLGETTLEQGVTRSGPPSAPFEP